MCAKLLLRQEQRHDRSLRSDTIGGLVLMQVSRRQNIPVKRLNNWAHKILHSSQDLPSWSIILQVLAFPFKHATLHLDCCWMIFTGVRDSLCCSERYLGAYHLIAVC